MLTFRYILNTKQNLRRENERFNFTYQLFLIISIFVSVYTLFVEEKRLKVRLQILSLEIFIVVQLLGLIWSFFNFSWYFLLGTLFFLSLAIWRLISLAEDL